MKGKIFPTEDGYIVESLSVRYAVREEDNNIPYISGSDVEFGLIDNKAIIWQCTTSAEVYNLTAGWICPRCNRVNAPFNRFCDC
jgi:hypothetical protein